MVAAWEAVGYLRPKEISTSPTGDTLKVDDRVARLNLRLNTNSWSSARPTTLFLEDMCGLKAKNLRMIMETVYT